MAKRTQKKAGKKLGTQQSVDSATIDGATARLVLAPTDTKPAVRMRAVLGGE